MNANISYDRNWTWVTFDSKPADDIRKALKDIGALFSFNRKAWYIRARMPESVINQVINSEPVKETVIEPVKKSKSVFIQPPNPITTAKPEAVKPGLTDKQRIDFVCKGAGKSTSLAVLNNVLLSRKDNVLTMQSTNLERGFETYVISHGLDFRMTVPASFLKSVNVNLDDITCNMKDQSIKTNGNNINGLSADEFPPFPNTESWHEPKIDATKFWNDFSKVKEAAGGNHTPEVLHGVFVAIADGEYRGMTACDGDVLHTTTTINTGINIPCKVLSDISMYKGNDLELRYKDNQVLLSFNGLRVISQLIEGEYPDTRKVIPASNEYNQVNKNEFLAALKTCNVFARDGMGKVTINFNGKCTLSSDVEDLGRVQRSMTYSGSKELIITAKVNQLIDAVKSVKGDVINIGMNTDKTPIDIVEDDLHIVVLPV